MIAGLLAHLRGQWMGALALFLVLTGIGALAAAFCTLGSGSQALASHVGCGDMITTDRRSTAI